MLIRTGFDLFLMIMTIVLAGALGGLLSGVYLDVLHDAKTEGEHTDNKKVQPLTEMVDTDIQETKVGTVNNKPKAKLDKNEAIAMERLFRAEGSNVRYKDGEKYYSGGSEFLEGINHRLKEEVKAFEGIDVKA